MQYGYAQSITAIKKRADAAFEKKEYEAAKVDYRQLLAQNQKNPELNYKYATCIYYTEDIKNARKYYDFILAKKDAVFPLETYYYLGKIYQHQYYFETAIQQFNTLTQKDPKLALQLDVQSEINACQYAMQGMKNMLTLNVLKKSQPYGEAFYNHYTFVDDAFSFYKASEVFPKENGKHQYEPIYAFKRGMKYRVFASYGPESPNLDLYVQRKNANNEWDKPIKILGQANSTSDEIYPFYDAEYGYLYFSSKGHQSMGGYDLFRAKYDLEQNVSSDVENLHFPYSSPNDDYFYIPDLVSGNANFASNRNGKLNAVETYLVSAALTPKELQFITGILTDQIDQTNKSVKIEIIVPETNERFGPFVSQLNGNYLIGLPGPGSYQMEITVTGSNKVFSESLDIPVMDSDYELQQELIYSMVDSKEQLKVMTRMKPKTVDNMALLSEKLNLASKMDVNLASFNRKVELTPQQKMQMEWGVTAKDTANLIVILSDSLLAAEVNLENQVRLTNYLAEQLKEKQAEFQGQMTAFDQRMEKGSGTLDPVLNEQWLQESKQMEKQLDAQLKDIQFLQDWMTANQQRGIPNIQVLKSLEEINQQIALLQYQQNSEAIMDLLTEKKTLIKDQLAVAGEDLAAVIRTYAQEQERMQNEELAQYKTQEENQVQLEQQLSQLKTQASTAKGKERQALDAQILEKEQLNAKLKKELKNWSEQLEAQATSANVPFHQRQSLVEEVLLSSEKMPLPTAAIPFDLAKEQAKQAEFIQQRTAQQQQLSVQTAKVKKWTAIDPNYSADIAQINAANEDPIKRAELLKQRETIHVNQLKAAATNATEGEQELLQEQIQLAENRLKSQEETLAQLNTQQTTTNGQQTTGIVQPETTQTTDNGQRTSENGQRTTGIVQPETTETTQTTDNGQRTSENGQRTTGIVQPETTETTANGQRTTESGQRTTGIGQPEITETTQTTDNGQRTSENGQRTTGIVQPETTETTQTTDNGQRTTDNGQRTTDNGQRTTGIVQPETTETTDNGQQTTGIVQPETTETAQTSDNGQRTTGIVQPETTQTTDNGQRTTANGQRTTDNGQQTTGIVQPETTETTQTTDNGQRTTGIGQRPTDNGQRTTSNGLPETIQVDQVKETARMTSIEESIRQVDQMTSTSVSPKEKAQLKAELEAALILEKRRAAMEESLELLGASYPSIRDMQVSHEQASTRVNTLNLQALEQALAAETNPEKAKILQTQIASIQAIQPTISSRETTPIPNRSYVLPLATEEPANLNVLQTQSSYVQYANQRVSYQENTIKLDSLRQVKSEIEDNMRILLTAENEIAIRELQVLAGRHAELTQDIAKRTEQLHEQHERLVDFVDQSSYEWMMQNGIPASSTVTSSNQVSNTVSTTTVPFAMNAVATMNQRFPDHPINVPLPNGLIFRVQVGAFRKPVPNQLFREFGPVSGEVLNNGLTCYLAGYFNGSTDAIQARTNIRKLGYADAFIVAYCDGKRMSFNEGKLMEANGTCRKQTSEELQLALNELMRNQATVSTVTPEVARPTANTPDANSTEANLDLYYTVQVAVYNKALTSDNIQGIGELLVTKTEKGQYRYSSGEFTSFAEARQRKNEVVAKGIQDAYVVAYYRGKRISIGEANQLLAAGVKPKKRGEVSIPTETNVATEMNVPVVIPALVAVVKRDSTVQYELRVDESNYLGQLSRFNRVGTFTYQAEKNRILSPKYILDSLTVNQQLYLADMKRIKEKASKVKPLEVEISSAQLKGDFYDWLLRQNISYDAHKKDEVWIFHFYPENETQLDQLEAVSTMIKWKRLN